MLKLRVLSGIGMAFGFLSLLFLLPATWFCVVILAVLAIGAWEWTNLSNIQAYLARAGYVFLVIGLCVLTGYFSAWGESTLFLKNVFIAGCVWWAVALLWVQGYPSSQVFWGSAPARLAIGLCVLVPAWAGFAFLRIQEQGEWLVLLAVALVAAADIGAYFAGKAFGKHKLAPAVSPGKTWEGVVGGVILCFLIAIFFGVASKDHDIMVWLLIALPIPLVSVLGDLLESMFKRHRGIKDSGRLIPGHGGVLDRIDGLVAALPVLALIVLVSEFSL